MPEASITTHRSFVASLVVLYAKPMKLTPRVLVVLSLGASIAIHIACATPPPANSNQPSVNANAAPSNSSVPRASQPPDATTTGTVEVTSNPPGARVLLIQTEDDTAGEPQPKGVTPATITGVKPGKYTVDLERSGYRFFQKEIVVKKGGATKVSANLRKQ